MLAEDQVEVTLPSLFLGTERIGSVLLGGSRFTHADVFEFLDGWFDRGGRALDTAASYQLGGTEKLLGEWIASRRLRQRLFLSSKGGHPVPLLAPNRLGPADLDADLHASLKRLRTDFLDLYLLHRDHPDADLEAIVRCLDAHERSGKIRAWGVSNWRHERVARLHEIARACGSRGVRASSPQFSLAMWSAPPWQGCVSISGGDGVRSRAFHETSRIPVIAYSALGRGFVRGAESAAYCHPENATRHRRARELAEKKGLSLAEVALGYVVSQPFSVHPVVSTRSLEHWDSNSRGVGTRLDAADVAWLETGVPSERKSQ